MRGLLVPISPGELIDKICILELKAEKISDSKKQEHILHELTLLHTIFQECITISPELDALIAQLKIITRKGWESEEVKRACEAAEDFGPVFIGAARDAYTNNDERADICRQINVFLKSEIVQEKSYRHE